MDDDLDMENQEDLDRKTVPSPLCEGSVDGEDCLSPIEVIFLRTGAKMCAEHALDLCGSMAVREREERDTDRAAPDGGPTLPPLSKLVDDDSPAPMPPPDSEDVVFEA